MFKDSFVRSRNLVISFLYRYVVKNIVFLIDPEKVHDFFILTGRFLGSNCVTRFFVSLSFSYSNDKFLKQELLGITFKNPLGLAAGFDKNAQIMGVLPAVGFGFAEMGSVTGEECEGNAKPRLWRLKKSRGLLVHYGLKNNGAEEISKRLKSKKFAAPFGVSIAKTNCKLTASKAEGIKDYLKAYDFFAVDDLGAYITINISCPNAYGGQPFTKPEDLDDLLSAIFKKKKTKPVFVKLSPDLSFEEVDALISVIDKYDIDALICTNLTKNRDNAKILEKDLPEHGGVSGKPLEDLTNRLITHVYQKTKGKYVIIGCGGVFSAEDAYAKIKAGASLIQLITGMIFEGPQVLSEINLGLVDLLKKDGYSNISEAVGSGN